MKHYSTQAIEMFTKYVRQDTEGFNWLVDNGYPELLATLNAIRDDKKSFKYLMDNKHFELAAFVNSIWDDPKALKVLLHKKAFDWAACSNIINGDETAQDALLKMKKVHFVNLAYAIQLRIHEDGDRNISPWGVIQNMFDVKKLFKKDENS